MFNHTGVMYRLILLVTSALFIAAGAQAVRQKENAYWCFRGKYRCIETILFSHLHMDHDGGLPPILAMSFFHNMAAGVERTTPYTFAGPSENAVSPFPSINAYLDGHFSADAGLECYLAGFPPALGGDIQL